MRTAVVGHLEWSEFVRVERLPRPGEILEPTESFVEPAGGAAVAAVQLARLAGDCVLYTALGDDDITPRVIERLGELGVRVEAVLRPGKPTRRAFVYLDDHGERTITTIGERHHPKRADELPWDDFARADGVYFVGGDEEALRAVRAARCVVATARVVDVLGSARVQLDAVVGSSRDEAERYQPIDPPPRYVVATAGSHGGSWSGAEGREGSWAAVPLPGPVRDAYGAGDSFSGGLTFALARGDDIDTALELGARCGAMCMTSRGPYERQLTATDLAAIGTHRRG